MPCKPAKGRLAFCRLAFCRPARILQLPSGLAFCSCHDGTLGFLAMHALTARPDWAAMSCADVRVLRANAGASSKPAGVSGLRPHAGANHETLLLAPQAWQSHNSCCAAWSLALHNLASIQNANTGWAGGSKCCHVCQNAGVCARSNRPA